MNGNEILIIGGLIFILGLVIVHSATTSEDKCLKASNYMEHAYYPDERWNNNPLCYRTMIIDGKEYNVTHRK